jgi:hypothetical protein
MSELGDLLENGSCIVEGMDKTTGILTEEHWDYSLQGTEDETYVSASIFILFFVIGVPLNLYVLWKILKKSLFSDPTYMLLINICVTDLVMCFVSILFNISMGFNGHSSFGKSDYTRCQVCKIAVVFSMVNVVSALNLVLLSLDRCLYFTMPLRYPRLVTKFRTNVAIALIWCVGVALYVPVLVSGHGDVALSVSCGYIFTTSEHIRRSYAHLAVTGFLFIAAIVVIVVTNVVIICVVCKQQKKSDSMEMVVIGAGGRPQQSQVGERLKREAARQLKLLKVCGSILGVNFVTLIPATVLVVSIPFTTLPTWYYTLVLLCLSARVVLQPLVEAFLTPEIHCTGPCLSRQRH